MNKLDQLRLEQVLEDSRNAQLDVIKGLIDKLDNRRKVQLCTYVAKIAEDLIKVHENNNNNKKLKTK